MAKLYEKKYFDNYFANQDVNKTMFEDAFL